MSQRTEDLVAAMLARSVGSALNQVDQYTLEKTSQPANKIDMNKFVAPLIQGSATAQQVDNLMQRAIVPEDMVQRMVPDTSINHGGPGPVENSYPLTGNYLPPPISLPKNDHVERICVALETIVQIFQKKPKKKTRKKRETKVITTGIAAPIGTPPSSISLGDSFDTLPPAIS